MTEEEYTNILKGLLKEHKDNPDMAIKEFKKIPDKSKKVTFNINGKSKTMSVGIKSFVSMSLLHGIDLVEELRDLAIYEENMKNKEK